MGPVRAPQPIIELVASVFTEMGQDCIDSEARAIGSPSPSTQNVSLNANMEANVGISRITTARSIPPSDRYMITAQEKRIADVLENESLFQNRIEPGELGSHSLCSKLELPHDNKEWCS